MIAFLVLLAIWIVGEASLTIEDRPAPGTLALPTGLLVLASQLLAVLDRGEGAWWGAVVMVVGLALRAAAIATLGAAFATRLASPALITRGPYRWARHPSELGLLLILFGGAWLLGSRGAALVGAALVPVVMVRCHREDRALASLPGYAAWSRRVGWFAPRSWCTLSRRGASSDAVRRDSVAGSASAPPALAISGSAAKNPRPYGQCSGIDRGR